MNKIEAKSILQKVNGGKYNWFGIDYNINLYKGCSHGCIYCDSRSNCYKIDNFDNVRVKDNAINILYKELKSKRNKGVVGLGSMSDTYNPFERTLNVTRDTLKLIRDFGFGVAIDTKSSLITRDIDILKGINKNNSVIVKITITTFDDRLSKIIEPNVNETRKRFEVLRKLSKEGIFCGVLLTPILPFITDNELNIKNIVKEAYESGAKFIYSTYAVTLRENQRDYYYKKLNEQFQGLVGKYIKTYGNSYICNSLKAKSLKMVLEEQCQKYGLLYKMEDIIDAYKKDKEYEQISIF